MTENEVKEQLPAVLVRWNGSLWWGKVSGRCNPFATVAILEEHNQKGKYVKTIMGPCFEFSWKTIANAITSGRPLTI